MREQRQRRGVISSLSVIEDGGNAPTVASVVRKREQRARKQRLPARDHRVAGLRRRRLDERETLPEPRMRGEDGKRQELLSLFRRPAHAFKPAAFGLRWASDSCLIAIISGASKLSSLRSAKVSAKSASWVTNNLFHILEHPRSHRAPGGNAGDEPGGEGGGRNHVGHTLAVGTDWRRSAASISPTRLPAISCADCRRR